MRAVLFSALALFVGPAFAQGVNPNDFSWMRQTFNPQNYSWMSGSTKQNLSVPGFPVTISNAPFPKGWTVKTKNGRTVVTPPKTSSGKSKQKP